MHNKNKQLAPLFADEVRQRENRRRTQSPFWQVVSLVLHLSGFVAIVAFTPLREIVVPERHDIKTVPNMRAERVEELAENLRTVRLNELMEQLDALQIILHNMGMIKNDILGDYDMFAENETPRVKEEIKNLLEKTLSEQRGAVTAQKSAVGPTETIAKLQTNDLSDTNLTKRIASIFSEVRKGFPEIDSSQADAQHLIDQVSVQADLIGLRKTAEVAEVLRDVQLKANTIQREFQRNLGNVADAASVFPTIPDKIEKLDANIEETSKDVSEIELRIAQEKSNQEILKTDLAEAESNAEKRAADLTTAQPSTDVEGGDGSDIRKAELAAQEAENVLKAKKKALEESEKRLAVDEESKTTLEQQVDAWRNEIAALEKRRENAIKLTKQNPGENIEAQREAIVAQEELIKKVEELAKLAETEEPEPVKLAQEQFLPDPDSYRDMSNLDLVNAYETAKELEQKITEEYRDIKAAEAAMLRRMSFEAASQMTDVAKTVRPDAQVEILLSSPRDQAALDRQQEATVEVVREADNMVATTKTLLTSAMQIVKPGDGSLSASERLQRMYDLSGLSAELTAAAAESAQDKAKDLSALMAQVGTGSVDEPEDKVETLMEGQMAMRESLLKSPVPSEAPTLEGTEPELVPGNIINLAADGGGVPTKWMYVKSWYVIGPFPNPDRVNIRRRFPPESVIDLDATYVGKHNRIVKWQFEQAQSSLENPKNRANVIPESSEPYGIWYAVSDVFVDRDCDIWIAVGSDDRSDLWINDMHVWGSSNELKAWEVNEGFRKVRLLNGRNRFLARVENGWLNLGWSVCIALSDDVAL